ncbi:E3 ubiquitin-protein ligase MARCH3-like [Actinia tenebrosa]|uniref:E3 ubiquitin-protein ligase MARCH3-like n=1 Tax=Actinia tenebrosa TaxID=6105 RepID=A0A6P8IL51_ACTTE|nr:E3 ubiquitin-protein ligase MARCH3-like [Actinia tenebrosa]
MNSMDSHTVFKQSFESFEDYISSEEIEPNPEECTSLLNNAAKQSNEEKFTFIELQVLPKDDKEISPGEVPRDRLEKYDSDIECRICRCKGDEPLISPCKCSGSSKWIHQSCLIQWFQISRTSRCELCSETVIIRKYTKPICEWKRPKGGFGPCNKVDLWYLFVTLFSLGTIVGFAIFQGLMGAEESTETILVFVAIYILCAIMILVRIWYFYVWFTRKSTYWNAWRSLNQNWIIKSATSTSTAFEECAVV